MGVRRRRGRLEVAMYARKSCQPKRYHDSSIRARDERGVKLDPGQTLKPVGVVVQEDMDYAILESACCVVAWVVPVGQTLF